MSRGLAVPPGAVWIGSDHPFDLTEVYLNFRLDIDLPAQPGTALFTLTADSRYRLWVNGACVGRGPARSWPHRQAMDVLDLTPHLQAGPNRIALQVYGPGYSHFAYVHRGAMGWLGWITLDGRVLAVSDQSWRVRRDASWAAQVPRVSIYGSGVEQRDMALDEDWQVMAPDTRWAMPRIVAPAESPLWSGLHLHDGLRVEERLVPLDTPFQTRLGQVAGPPLPDPHLDLRRALPLCPVATSSDRLSPGQTAIWVFDLGHSQTVVGRVDIRGAAGTERLSISYAEKLRDGGLLLSDPATYCRMRPTDQFHLRAGDQTVEGFTPRGARYVVFRLDADRGLDLDMRFAARISAAVFDELPPQGHGDPVLDAVDAMCRRTIRTCLQDGFVDSIWRESSQWLGDVVPAAFALSAMSRDPRPLRQAITMAAEGALADGILPSVLPSEVHAYVVTDYNFSWIELLEQYRTHPGVADPTPVLVDQLPVLKRMLARFRQDLGPDGLLRSQPGRRLFLDWSGQDRREPNLTYNLRYLHGLQLASNLARNLGKDALAETWAGQATGLTAALRRVLYGPGRWVESPEGSPASQLALALLLLTGVVDGAKAAAMADAIVARSLDLDDTSPPGKLMLASPFMHHYVFQALHRLGRGVDIRAIIRARWGRWAMAGEPTTWENWAVDFPDGSVCHGFSAHPLGWLARTRADQR